MNSDFPPKVTNKIEELCKQGCSHVNRVLEKSQNGKIIEELSEFNRTEIDQIISELGKIMSVYDEKSPGNNNDSNCNN